MPSTSAWSAWPSSAWRTYREALNKSCRARRCFSGMRCQAPDPRQAWTACLAWQQRRSPGKAPSRRARTKTGPLSTKFLARASSTGCETLAAKSSRFCRERAWQHLFRASLAVEATQRLNGDVFHGAGVAVVNHVVRVPVDLLVAEFVDIAVADPGRAQVLDLDIRGVVDAAGLHHLLVGLVFLDRQLAFRVVLHVEGRDLAVLGFDGDRVRPFLVDDVVPIGLQLVPDEGGAIVVVVLGLGQACVCEPEQTRNEKAGSQKAPCAVHVQSPLPCLACGMRAEPAMKILRNRQARACRTMAKWAARGARVRTFAGKPWMCDNDGLGCTGSPRASPFTPRLIRASSAPRPDSRLMVDVF